MTDQFGLLCRYVVGSRDRDLRDHQDVRRCLRVDVAKGEDAIILVDDVGRNLAGDDF